MSRIFLGIRKRLPALGATLLLLFLGMAAALIGTRRAGPDPSATAPPSAARVELWTTAHQVMPGDDLSLVRESVLPPEVAPDLPPLDQALAPWGLRPAPAEERILADGQVLRREIWSGAAAGQGVLWIPPMELVLPGGVLTQPEILLRIGEDPEGPLPPPAPERLSELPLPAAPGEPPFARWLVALITGLALAAGLSGSAGLWRILTRKPPPAPPDPLELLRTELSGRPELRTARALAADYLARWGDLPPGVRDSETVRAAAERAGWRGESTARWFERSRDALYAPDDATAEGDALTGELLHIVRDARSPAAEGPR